MKITILGSGSAYGVPYIGGGWGKCDPNNPKNRRLCPSVLIENDNTKFMVDMGPDIRQQAEKHQIGLLDGLFITHPHADHISGMCHLPMMMVYYKDTNLPIYADRFTRKEIEKNWWYMFDPKINVEYSGEGRPYFTEVIPYCPIKIGDIEVMPLLQDHNSMNSLGLRIGNFAYCTDIRRFPEKSYEMLQDLDVFIVDCNNEFDTDKSHSYLEQSLRWAKELRAKKTYLTHLDYTMDYDTISAKLPENVFLAYDNLVLNCD